MEKMNLITLIHFRMGTIKSVKNTEFEWTELLILPVKLLN